MDANGNPFDVQGGTFGSPDASLDDWLRDPTASEFIKQKALEHAQSALGFTIDSTGPYAQGDPDNAGAYPPPATPPLPQAPATGSIFGRLGKLLEGSPDPTASQGPVTLNPSGVAPAGSPPAPQPAPTPGAAPPVNANPFDPEPNPSPVAPGTIPLPRPNPTQDTDVSSQEKKKTVGDALSNLSKTLAGVKPIAPPPVNAVGTPGVRSPQAVNAPNLSQILQLLGAQAKPDPISTLGRLLVAGKA